MVRRNPPAHRSPDPTSATARCSARPSEAPRNLPAWAVVGLLAVILAGAALLRTARLTDAPPGLNQDEAVNAWNAWCLLKTGQDQAGVPWPIFYYRALGGNSTTLYMYLTIPFQAIWGMNVWTSRLPSVFCGLATILAAYYAAARIWGRPVALVAAGLLTLSPWHVLLSRWGHEAAVCPLATCGSLAVLLWAGFPLCDRPGRPAAWRALLAGLVIGVFCYGYASIRLFLPVFLTGCVLVTARGWLGLLRERRGQLALAGLALGVAVTFGPLAYQHVAHPEGVAKRGENQWVWEPDDPTDVILRKVAGRYLSHFGPDFLFLNGDRAEIQALSGRGTFQWYVLPLMLAGLVVLGASLTRRDGLRSRKLRIMLCWLLLYPLGDCLNRGKKYPGSDGQQRMSMHVLRSSPGLVGPVMLAAVGATALGTVLWRRQRALAGVAATGLLAAAAYCDTGNMRYLFGEHNRRPEVYHGFHADLVEALQWLRPHVDGADNIFITARGMNAPYIVSLVVLNHDPQKWFSEPRQMVQMGPWEHYSRVGKLYFLYNESGLKALSALQADGRPQRVLLLLRPDETRPGQPVYTVSGPDGRPILFVYAGQM